MIKLQPVKGCKNDAHIEAGYGWWCATIILICIRIKQDDQKFEDTLYSRATLCL